MRDECVFSTKKSLSRKQNIQLSIGILFPEERAAYVNES